MNQTSIDLIIGAATFFLTSIANALVLGIWLGGLKAEVRMMADRLAKIEGVFTLVPNIPKDLNAPH